MGPRRRRRGRRRASPSTPPTSWATSCSSSCPTAGRALDRHATFGVVESVKAVSDLFAPVAGEVVGRQRGPRRLARSSSTATRTARAGCSGCGSPTRPRSRRCSTPPPTSSSSPRADPMPYGPHAADDRARMLETIGIDSVDALFEDIPAALRAGPLRLDEPGARARADARASPAWPRATACDLASLPRRRRLPPLDAGRRRPDAAPRRVVHGLHAVPARGQPGDAPEHLRVPVAARPSSPASTSSPPRTTTAARRRPRPR